MPEPPAAVFAVRHVPGRALARLCFGADIGPRFEADGIFDGRRFEFRAGQRFAVLWWERTADAADLQWRSVAVLQALGPGASGQRPMPDVTGSIRLLGVVGQAGSPGSDGAVDRLLDLIAGIVDLSLDPAGLPVAFWRAAVTDVQFGRRPDPSLLSRRRLPTPRSRKVAA